jgi:hypothetical protein
MYVQWNARPGELDGKAFQCSYDREPGSSEYTITMFVCVCRLYKHIVFPSKGDVPAAGGQIGGILAAPGRRRGSKAAVQGQESAAKSTLPAPPEVHTIGLSDDVPKSYGRPQAWPLPGTPPAGRHFDAAKVAVGERPMP